MANTPGKDPLSLNKKNLTADIDKGGWEAHWPGFPGGGEKWGAEVYREE